MNQSYNDGTTRTRDQRCHDALVQLSHAAAKGDIKGGRSNTKLLATVPFDTIVERTSLRGVTHVGPTLDPATMRKLARDQHCRWPGCTIRATWCDAHHIVEWTDHGPTTDENCALFCHRHHQLSHQPGWSITGTGHELTIHHSDGGIETSKPPGVAPIHADSIGREPTARHASATGSVGAECFPPSPTETLFDLADHRAVLT